MSTEALTRGCSCDTLKNGSFSTVLTHDSPGVRRVDVLAREVQVLALPAGVNGERDHDSMVMKKEEIVKSL